MLNVEELLPNKSQSVSLSLIHSGTNLMGWLVPKQIGTGSTISDTQRLGEERKRLLLAYLQRHSVRPLRLVMALGDSMHHGRIAPSPPSIVP